MYTYVLIWQIVQRCSCLTVWGCIGVAFLQMPNVAQIGVHCLNAFCVSIVIHCSPLAMVDIYWKCTVQKHTIESYSNKIKVKNKTKLQHNWNSSNTKTLREDVLTHKTSLTPIVIACTKQGSWAMIYLCAKGIYFASFYDFGIGLWTCSDSMVFSSSYFIRLEKICVISIAHCI
jgi:hypothetical protein